MKKLALPVIGVGTAALAISIAASAAGAAPVAAAGPRSGAGAGAGTCTTCTVPAAVPVAPLTAAQSADLKAMAEEEKVARDLYLAFAARYPTRAWDNIAAAEAAHLTAIRTLLARYGVADPTAGRAAGSFASSAAQSMYDRLLAQGSASEVAAFGVGRAVEVDDIAKLDAAIGRATQADVKQVYANLRKGSTQHLRAFTSLLGR